VPSSSIGFWVAKTWIEGVGLPLDRHPVFLHRLEERGLGLGRSSIDLVGQDHVGEDRTRNEHQPTLAADGIVLNDVGAGHVGGHQVGSELDALEREVEHLGQRLDQERLGQARHAHQQAIPSGEQRHQRLLHDPFLADDSFGKLGANPAGRGVKLIGQRPVVGRIGCQRPRRCDRHERCLGYRVSAYTM
jgi:hypothetical protein